jgi:hypothetical protein
VVANATITLTDEATNAKRTTRQRRVCFPRAPVSTNDISVGTTRFKNYLQRTIVLEVGSSISINASLAVGSNTQTIEVQDNALSLQTEDATFKQAINRKEVNEMPLNGRQMTALITLSGGSNTAPGGDFTGSKYSYQTIAVSIISGGTNTTPLRLDDGDNQDYMANGNLPYSFPDAVSEFSVESTALSAQDGGHVGSMVNMITRSGTNPFHSEASELIRNNLIDATNFFSSTPDILHQISLAEPSVAHPFSTACPAPSACWPTGRGQSASTSKMLKATCPTGALSIRIISL